MTATVLVNTHSDSDVQLVFVGEENTNGPLVFYRGGHDVSCVSAISTLSVQLLQSSLGFSILHFLSAPWQLVHVVSEKMDDIMSEISKVIKKHDSTSFPRGR